MSAQPKDLVALLQNDSKCLLESFEMNYLKPDKGPFTIDVNHEGGREGASKVDVKMSGEGGGELANFRGKTQFPKITEGRERVQQS